MANMKSEIHFGLVNIPVLFKPVIRNNDISFHQLHKTCMGRIRYQKVCPHCKKIVKETDLVKGYEYSKDEYVTFTKAEVKAFQVDEDGIEIIAFVSKSEIASYYYEKSYVLVPPKKSKVFSLFGSILRKSKKVALGKTVLGSKFYYVVIEFMENYLLLNTLYFKEEVNLPTRIEEVRFTKKELELGELLVKQLTASFTPDKYEDDYKKQIKEAIDDKLSGKKIRKGKSKKRKSVKDLVTALQDSLDVSS